jgi:hypothetical protein
MLHELFEAIVLKTVRKVIVYVNVTRVIRSRHVENIKVIVYVKCYTSFSKPSCCKYWMR